MTIFAFGAVWFLEAAHMERFVRRQNVKHYEQLLKTVSDEAERRAISKLLAEERQKQQNAGDGKD